MKQKFMAFYNSLPTWVQGLIVAAEGGAIGFLAQWALNPGPLCFKRACLKQFGGALLGAVVSAIRNWLRQSPLMRPLLQGVGQAAAKK